MLFFVFSLDIIHNIVISLILYFLNIVLNISEYVVTVLLLLWL